MEEKNYDRPAEILQVMIKGFRERAAAPAGNLILLGMAAGAFISLGAGGSNMVAFNLLADPATFGLGRAVAGIIFGTGLMLVLVAGGELFTGNTMMIAGVLDKKISWRAMLRNWGIVFPANLAGALLIAWMMFHTGLFDSGAAALGGMTIKIAVYKVGLTALQAFLLGILCNWLVCLAIWMAAGARDVTGKLLSALFPIWLFVASGFEHCVANMYLIPAGILAKANPGWARAALDLGVEPRALEALDWGSFFVRNLLPVTVGNAEGGGLLVAGLYWMVYRRREERKPA